MAEKKNIVIKLKYPVGEEPKNSKGTVGTSAKTVAIWDFKRIAMALLVLVAIAVLLVFVLKSKPVDDASPKSALAPVPQPISPVPNPGAGQAPAPITPSMEPNKPISMDSMPQPAGVSVKTAANPTLGRVVRSVLTTKVINSEPVGSATLPIVAGEKEPVTLVYFVELADMKGKTVYHEWLLDNQLISKKQVNISDTQWRTTSKQNVAFTTNSNWTVRLVDGKGTVLSQQQFNVALKK